MMQEERKEKTVKPIWFVEGKGKEVKSWGKTHQSGSFSHLKNLGRNGEKWHLNMLVAVWAHYYNLQNFVFFLHKLLKALLHWGVSNSNLIFFLSFSLPLANQTKEWSNILFFLFLPTFKHTWEKQFLFSFSFPSP